MLIGTETEINPTVKNLGTVIANPKYSLVIKCDGTDVTANSYNSATKKFKPEATGEYSLIFTALNSDGTVAKDKNGGSFTKTFVVNVVSMNFVPKAGAGIDVTVDNTNELKPKITFGASYATTSGQGSGQYRVTGVTFKGDYKVTYKISGATANMDSDETKLYFGIDRTDINERDDNISLNLKDGTLSAWFFNDEGSPAGGNDWTGTGWLGTKKSVSKFGAVSGEHTISFARIIDKDKNATYAIEWDGASFVSLPIKKNYTDLLKGIWIESKAASASVEIEGYEALSGDSQKPIVSFDSEKLSECALNESFDIRAAMTITDNSDYAILCNLAYTVTDPNGEAVVVTEGKFTPTKKGEYSISVVATDLSGNASDAIVAKVTSDIVFSYGAFAGTQHIIATESTFTPVYKNSTMQVTIVDVQNKQNTIPVAGDSENGFTFTPTVAGIYAVTTAFTKDGAAKSYTTYITAKAQAADTIDLSANTEVARTKIAHIFYYGVKTSANADNSANATFKILKGADLTTAQDVTSAVTFVRNSIDNTLKYNVFKPVDEGTYYLVVTAQDGETKAFHKFDVRDDVEFVYGNSYKLDLGNSNLDKMVVGKDTVIFENVNKDNKTSKIVYDNLTIKENWTIEFDVTDLKYAAQGKLFFTLGLKPDTEGGNWQWDDLSLGGNVKQDGGFDFWGFETNTVGAGWLSYQWRGTWQAPVTQEFCPLDADGNPIAFREAGEYNQYGTGTHHYKIKMEKNSTNGQLTLLYWIDGRAEARHVLASNHTGYSSIGCVVIWSENMNGIVSNIQIAQN